MKKNVLFKKIPLILLCSILIGGLAASCASTNYIEKNYPENMQKLMECQAYNDEVVDSALSAAFEIREIIDPVQAKKIREYFKENAGLDLDALAASPKTTWEKAVELAVFVAKNVPHDNQKKPLDDRSAIPLWEYSRQVKTGFNCRWHSILLSELMLSIGIKARFITCLPQDKKDGDCHVVDLVWLPELNKYAMIDSDMLEYVVDEDGLPMSLEEMRAALIAGEKLNIQVLPGFEDSWVAKESGLQYMQAYWTKNLYWFSAHTSIAFNLEGTNRPQVDSYTALIPPGYDCSHSYRNGLETSNAKVFWGE